MKILFIAMHHSVHTGRWISQLKDENWEIHLFPVDFDERPVHELIKNEVIFHRYIMGNHKLLKYIPKIISNVNFRARKLAEVINKIKPDIIHSLEMQHSAYLTSEVKKSYKGKFPPWIYSCWGSDIYYFQQFFDHKDRMSEVLSSINYLFTDCNRDVELAIKYGFKGEVLGVFPGVGGYKIEEMRSTCTYILPSERKIIAVKGYDGWVYRARVLLRAIEKCGEVAKGYTIVLYLALPDLIEEAINIGEKIGCEVKILPHSPYHKILELFSLSRLALASSISDGTPNSMLEAMVMGAFPIQSNTISTEEWIKHGRNGLLAPPEEVDDFVKNIKEALTNDKLVDSAATENYLMLKNRIDYSLVQPKVVEAYTNISIR